jgi:hypothetical protein
VSTFRLFCALRCSHFSYLKNVASLKEIEAKIKAEQLEEKRREHALHLKTRSDVVIKYFAEKVSPAVHDVAAKKEGML